MERRRGLRRFFESVTGRIPDDGSAPGPLGLAVIEAAAAAIVDGPAGPSAPNVYVVTAEFADPTERENARWDLADLVRTTALERGWRLEGPVEISFGIEPSAGRTEVQTAFETGDLPPWGWLVANEGRARLPLVRNRVLVGRGKDNDVVVAHPSVSRRHALVWREMGGHWIADLTSSNGTFVDDEAVYEVVPLAGGAAVRFGEALFTLETA